ncbi:MAG: hypothetical protein ACPGR7_07665 [Flavobacteriaceae bacterium]
MSKTALITLFAGVLLVVIGLILRYFENNLATGFLGLGLILESFAFMKYAWNNIKRK